jgi:indole-3-glycerol phosphate synthase
VLEEILAGVREDVAARQERVPLEQVREAAGATPPAIDAYAALRKPGVAVIAEVKRSSPSKGALADIPDPAELATEYAAAPRCRCPCSARISSSPVTRCTRLVRTAPTWCS